MSNWTGVLDAHEWNNTFSNESIWIEFIWILYEFYTYESEEYVALDHRHNEVHLASSNLLLIRHVKDVCLALAFAREFTEIYVVQWMYVRRTHMQINCYILAAMSEFYMNWNWRNATFDSLPENSIYILWE